MTMAVFAHVTILQRIILEACNFIEKEASAQVFSCEFCEISKNTFFTENVQVIGWSFILHATGYFALKDYIFVQKIKETRLFWSL